MSSSHTHNNKNNKIKWAGRNFTRRCTFITDVYGSGGFTGVKLSPSSELDALNMYSFSHVFTPQCSSSEKERD